MRDPFDLLDPGPPPKAGCLVAVSWCAWILAPILLILDVQDWARVNELKAHGIELEVRIEQKIDARERLWTRREKPWFGMDLDPWPLLALAPGRTLAADELQLWRQQVAASQEVWIPRNGESVGERVLVEVRLSEWSQAQAGKRMRMYLDAEGYRLDGFGRRSWPRILVCLLFGLGVRWIRLRDRALWAARMREAQSG